MTGPPPDRLTTALADRYRIERELGAGGMATVYLADDRKHDRKVALKVLKPELAAVVGAERFLAEIKTTANLQHPHILPLFDSGEAAGFLWYAMPYVEGESLRERIDREKQLPVEEAVGIAAKVLGALEEAHDRGVVHRDIKPANILLDHRGEPLVADFGIALAVQEAGGGRLTETGLSLGTPYYMSPEQATGDREPDARSDVYSLGCVLYEMLTGEPPFQGTTAQAVLGRIITGEVTRPTEVRKSVPANVEAAVLTALEKLPADRFGSAGEFAKALGDPGYRHASASTGSRPTDGGRALRLGASVAVAALAFLVGLTVRSEAPPPADIELVVDLGLQASPRSSVLVGPQGAVAFMDVSDRGEAAESFLRSPTGLEVTPLGLTSTEYRGGWAFSPDGRFIAVSVGNDAIDRITVGGGGRAQLHPPPPTGVEGSFTRTVQFWTDEGVVVVERGFLAPPGRLVRLREDRLEPEVLFDYGGWAPVDYRWAPGPEGVFFAQAPIDNPFAIMADSARILAAHAESGDTAEVVAHGSDPHWVDTGHLVYLDPSARVMALPFDADALRPTGPAVDLGISVGRTSRQPGQIDVSGGNLLYLRNAVGFNEAEVLEWWDPTTGATERLRLPASRYSFRLLSPDGRKAIVAHPDQWGIRDLLTGAWDRDRNSGPGRMPAGAARWSPTGDAVAWFESPDSGRAIRVASGPGFAQETRVEVRWADDLETGGWAVDVWPRDTLMLASVTTEATGRDVVELRREADVWIARRRTAAPWSETITSVSPDLRWVTIVERPDSMELWLRPLDAFDEGVRLAASDTRLRTFGNSAWVDGGRTLIYSRADSVFRVDVSGNGLTPLLGESRSIAQSQDGFGPHPLSAGPDGRILRGVRADGGEEVAPEDQNRLILVTGLRERIRRLDPGLGGGG